MSATAGGERVKLNTGFEMPLVGFGTYKVTGQEAVDRAVDAALQAGYRHFDTAKYYVNEPELGNALEVGAGGKGCSRPRRSSCPSTA